MRERASARIASSTRTHRSITIVLLLTSHTSRRARRLGGNVQVGAATMIGLGANVIHGLVIGAHTVIGAGSTVVGDVGDNVVALGSPARVRRTRSPGDRYL